MGTVSAEAHEERSAWEGPSGKGEVRLSQVGVGVFPLTALVLATALHIYSGSDMVDRSHRHGVIVEECRWIRVGAKESRNR